MGIDGKGEKLVVEVDIYDWDGGLFYEVGKVVDGFLVVSWVIGIVGDEDIVVVVSDFLDGVVVGKDGNGGIMVGEVVEDVFFDIVVD